MAFTPKDWRNATASTGGGDESTPLNAAALEDMETRLSGYSDTAVAAWRSAGRRAQRQGLRRRGQRRRPMTRRRFSCRSTLRARVGGICHSHRHLSVQRSVGYKITDTLTTRACWRWRSGGVSAVDVRTASSTRSPGTAAATRLRFTALRLDMTLVRLALIKRLTIGAQRASTLGQSGIFATIFDR